MKDLEWVSFFGVSNASLEAAQFADVSLDEKMDRAIVDELRRRDGIRATRIVRDTAATPHRDGRPVRPVPVRNRASELLMDALHATLAVIAVALAWASGFCIGRGSHHG